MKCDECGGKLVQHRTGFVMRLEGREFPTSAAYQQCEDCEAWLISHEELCKAEVESAVQLLTEIDQPISGEDLKWARKAGWFSCETIAAYLGMSSEEYEELERSSGDVALPIRFSMAWLVEHSRETDPSPLGLTA